MAKKNTFYGASMLESAVSAFYPNDPDFDHFVFQQMIMDPTKPDDDFTLMVYAVNNRQVPELLSPLTPVNSNPKSAGKKAQFANMRLDAVGLANLYPNGVNSDMAIMPTGFYPGTEYIQYTAYTADNPPDILTGGGYPINPSPPA